MEEGMSKCLPCALSAIIHPDLFLRFYCCWLYASPNPRSFTEYCCMGTEKVERRRENEPFKERAESWKLLGCVVFKMLENRNSSLSCCLFACMHPLLERRGVDETGITIGKEWFLLALQPREDSQKTGCHGVHAAGVYELSQTSRTFCMTAPPLVTPTPPYVLGNVCCKYLFRKRQTRFRGRVSPWKSFNCIFSVLWLTSSHQSLTSTLKLFHWWSCRDSGYMWLDRENTAESFYWHSSTRAM